MFTGISFVPFSRFSYIGDTANLITGCFGQAPF